MSDSQLLCNSGKTQDVSEALTISHHYKRSEVVWFCYFSFGCRCARIYNFCSRKATLPSIILEASSFFSYNYNSPITSICFYKMQYFYQ